MKEKKSNFMHFRKERITIVKKNNTLVLSVKVPEHVKKIMASLNTYLPNQSQGQIVEKALINYAESIGYTEHLKSELNEKGIVFSKIIYEVAQAASMELFQNREVLMRNFFEELNQGFEYISSPDMSNLIDKYDLVIDWEEYLEEKLMNLTLEKFQATINSKIHTGANDDECTSEFLFNIFSDLKKLLDIETKVQVKLANNFFDFSLPYYLEFIVRKFSNTELKMTQVEFRNILESLTLEEKTWLYTLGSILDSKFRGKMANLEKLNQTFDNIFEEKNHEIFKKVIPEHVIQKIQAINSK